jgi:hypothetical protein
MENGFGTADILTGRGLGLGGFGGYNYGGQFADMSSNAVRLNRNEGVTRDAAKCTQDTLTATLSRISDQAEEGRRSAQNTAVLTAITNSEFRTSDRLTAIVDGQFQAELRQGDRLRDIEREMAANARVAADCCCALKLQSCEDKAQILAAIAASNATVLAAESRGIERNLNNANAELTALRTQIACGCCPPRA